MGCSQSTPAGTVKAAPQSKPVREVTGVTVTSASEPSSAPSAAKTKTSATTGTNGAGGVSSTPPIALSGDELPGLVGASGEGSSRPRFDSFASGASTPDDRSDYRSDDETDRSHHSQQSRASRRSSMGRKNSKPMSHSTSAIGLDEMIEDRREIGDLTQNVVHIEVPFGKPIEEVYDGVHSGPVLGSGISGLVRLVTHKATGIKYAVKVLDLGLVDTAEGLKQLREEIFIMCQLDHPNIVRLEEVYESHSEIYLVQELCLGGELFDRLDEQPDYHYTEAECARLVKQMLSAVRYLHSRGIIHRDLKLENFLFSSTSKDSELKMIDFGLSKHFRYGEVQTQAVGTPYTVAPEVIRGSYDERCDIWAIGVITFLLLSGDPPFGGCGGSESLMQVRSNILACKFAFEPQYIWANVSEVATEFIKAMLVVDPQERPTARKAQKHTWLQEWASRSRKGNDNVLNPNVVKALVNFKEFSDMRKLLCEVLSFTLLPDQIKELRREFEKMDTDGSGEISLTALKQVLMTNAGAGSLGALTEEEVEDIFNAMRVRKTETRIHWHEFIAAGLSQCQVDDRNLRLAFDRLDSDHKGYIILDDIMDLMGSDALQSEEAMRRMWGDSIKAVKCQHARITYDDFLLLMKGQTKDHESQAQPVPSIVTGMLHVVPETDSVSSPDRVPPAVPKVQIVDKKPEIVLQPVDPLVTSMDDSNHTPPASPQVRNLAQRASFSAPSTPADHKRILSLEEIDSPLSIDDDDDTGPIMFGEVEGADALTPLSAPPTTTPVSSKPTMNLEAPSLSAAGGTPLPSLPDTGYTRRRSRSVDDRDSTEEKDTDGLDQVADIVRDMLLPETDHVHHGQPGLENAIKDETKSALVVNRTLYRAHRQMRLAVLDASKRFEEQQAARARDFILAQREEEEGEAAVGMIQAGLVMRHGHKEQVSSEAIRTLLSENQKQQQILVEKASRRGGRGRRSRKKTISDMSGMLTSLGQDDMGLVAAAAASAPEPPPMEEAVTMGASLPDITLGDDKLLSPTVPGEFRKTQDPFGKQGKYGAVAGWK